MKLLLKKVIKFSSIAAFFVVCSGFYVFKKGDCTSSEMTETAVDKLKKFTMIQNYPYYFKKSKKGQLAAVQKQVITLNRGVRYKFYAVKNEKYDGKPVISIYNDEKQEFLLGSTYNPTFKRFYNELEFECKTTGNYCLSFSFLDGEEGCALVVFSSLVKD